MTHKTSTKRIYTLTELKAMPTIFQGQFDDLKIETEDARIWLSRMTEEDGELCSNKVTVEKLKSGYIATSREAYRRGERGRWLAPYWVTEYTYEAK